MAPWLKELTADELRASPSANVRAQLPRGIEVSSPTKTFSEMIHANWFEEKLGPEITKQMALWVKDGHPDAKLFVNGYDIFTGNVWTNMYASHASRRPLSSACSSAICFESRSICCEPATSASSLSASRPMKKLAMVAVT